MNQITDDLYKKYLTEQEYNVFKEAENKKQGLNLLFGLLVMNRIDIENK